jgi:hypothetical protein
MASVGRRSRMFMSTSSGKTPSMLMASIGGVLDRRLWYVRDIAVAVDRRDSKPTIYLPEYGLWNKLLEIGNRSYVLRLLIVGSNLE